MRIDSDIINSTVELRHLLHKNAELSGKEETTKRILIDYIKENTSLEIADMGAWFYAAYRKANKNCARIAFRADMDALPIDEGCDLEHHSLNRGISHKCGHDGHCASLVALALYIDRHGAENEVFFLFQHAEETGAGAAVCKELITKESIDEVYGYHNMPGFPIGSLSVHDGCAACASMGLEIGLVGKNSHASQPENGINPAFAAAFLIERIPEMVKAAAMGKSVDAAGIKPASLEDGKERGGEFTAFGEQGMVMCTIVGGSVGSRPDGTGTHAFGTSAGYACVMLTMRAQAEEKLRELKNLVERTAEFIAEKEKLKVNFKVLEPFPETENNALCAQKVRSAAEKCGLKIAPWDEPFRSSEDFGYYTKATKGALFYLGCGEKHAPLHTVGYDFSDELIGEAAAVFACLARTDTPC